MSQLPNCPKCESEYTYEDGTLLVCPICAHEWNPDAEEEKTESEVIYKDANGNVLQDGDTVTLKNITLIEVNFYLIKDLVIL